MVGFLPTHIAQAFVTADKLNALAVGSARRHPLAPTVATLEELGQKGVHSEIWYAFFSPGKTPAPVVARLNRDISAILKLPKVRDLLGRVGLDAMSSSPEVINAVVQTFHAGVRLLNSTAFLPSDCGARGSRVPRYRPTNLAKTFLSGVDLC